MYQGMSYFVFGVIIFYLFFLVGGGWLRTKFSCEVYHRL